MKYVRDASCRLGVRSHVPALGEHVRKTPPGSSARHAHCAVVGLLVVALAGILARATPPAVGWVIPREAGDALYRLLPPPHAPLGDTGYVSYGVAIRQDEVELCLRRGNEKERFLLVHPSKALPSDRFTRHFAIRWMGNDATRLDPRLFQAVVASVTANEPASSPWRHADPPPQPSSSGRRIGKTSLVAALTAAALVALYVTLGFLRRRRSNA